jgi:hypothetical protein
MALDNEEPTAGPSTGHGTTSQPSDLSIASRPDTPNGTEVNDSTTRPTSQLNVLNGLVTERANLRRWITMQYGNIRAIEGLDLNKRLLMIARGNEYEARWPQLATLDTDEAQEEVTLAYRLKLDRLMVRLLQSTDGQAEVEMPPNESIATVENQGECMQEGVTKAVAHAL